MKVGDKIPVTVAGATVAEAEIKEVGDGTVTFIVPAKRVVMSTRTEFAPEAAPEVDTTGTQHVVDEVVRAPEAQTNAGGDVGQPTNVGNSVTVSDPEKVITSSSVPAANDAAVDPAKALAELPQAVQDQIASIVAAHNAAREQAESDQGTE